MKCECCGKEGQDKEKSFCYGCHHIICLDCCLDEDGELICGEHTINDHKKALKKREKKQNEQP